MNPEPALDAEPEDALAAASRWFARRRQGLSAREEAELTAWLEADPDHRQAWEDVTRGWELVGDAASHPRLCEMRSEALMMRPPRRRHLPAIAAALALALAGIGGTLGWLQSRPDAARPTVAQTGPRLYQTAIGERTTVTLDDGSVVTLNTASRLRVDYSRAERGVTLLAGQVLFQVAKDKARPFIVTAGNRQVVAIGTEFEVKLEGDQVRVALLEGRVRIRRIAPAPAAAPAGSAPRIVAEEATLDPGEQFVTRRDEVRVASADVADLISWREGRVRFDDTPLVEAVAEMNRYSRTPIVIADPRIAGIRVSGAFRTGQSASFVAAVTDILPVKADREGGTIRLRAGN